MRILVFPALDSVRLSRLQAKAGLGKIINVQNEEEAHQEIPAADAFLGKITPALLKAATRLKWVQSMTVSLEHYLFPELIQHECVLTNMRGIFSDVVAEHTFALMLAWSRNLPTYCLQQARAHWEPAGGESARVDFRAGPGVTNAIDLRHQNLSGKTLGIFGLGGIGQAIAKRGLAFEMSCLAHDPFLKSEKVNNPDIRMTATLAELLQQADYLVLAAPHTPQTEGLFSRQVFQKMQRHAFLVNIGRGALLNLQDLVDSLEAGEIAGAGLDVFQTEPLPRDHALWQMSSKVLITPHVAGYGPPIASRHLAVLEENVENFVQGKPLINVADKSRWC
ncbi:MAG: D-2-hydroxyacid dehydrogenase [Gemmataceae bacterium]|nr:D-2-hydroxyacid dehydrogenase [Gemmataceae bacterium]